MYAADIDERNILASCERLRAPFAGANLRPAQIDRALLSSSAKAEPCNAGKFAAIAARERQRSFLPVIPSASASNA